MRLMVCLPIFISILYRFVSKLQLADLSCIYNLRIHDWLLKLLCSAWLIVVIIFDLFMQVYRLPSELEVTLGVIKSYSKSKLSRQDLASARKHLLLFQVWLWCSDHLPFTLLSTSIWGTWYKVLVFVFFSCLFPLALFCMSACLTECLVYFSGLFLSVWQCSVAVHYWILVSSCCYSICTSRFPFTFHLIGFLNITNTFWLLI